MSDSERVASARAALRQRLEALIGPGPIERLDEALTHASFANETGAADNERLEFLGDAVLGLCVSEILAQAHADADEGLLTRMRSALVNAEALARWARSVELGECIALGRGATAGAERHQTNVLADAAEALVAAVYHARGLQGAGALVRDMVGDSIAEVDRLAALDPKSALQERVQAEGRAAPVYRVVRVDDSRPAFEVEVILDGLPAARGIGRSKRLAERAAAEAAMAKLAPP